MKNRVHFYFEGFADQVLLKVFQVPLAKFNANGKAKVIKTIKEQGDKNFHEIFVGLIDQDDVKSYPDFKEESNEKQVRVFKRKDNQFLIELCCPALESWLLKSAESAGINLEDFGFENSLEAFKRNLKSQTILKDSEFKKFLFALKESKNEYFERFNSVLADFAKHINQ
jgi:hypothetical protein